MKKVIFVFLLVALGTATSYGAPPTAEELHQKKVAAAEQLSKAVDTQFTAGGSISSDVLQAVGQAVLKKALRSGWTELASKLSELAGCSAKPQRLPKTCDVLGHARIEDLVASPKILLDAFLADLMHTLEGQLDKVPLEIKAPVAALLAGWIVFGSDSAAAHLKPWLKTQLASHAADVACPTQKAAAVAWVLGECIANDPNTAIALADLPSCDFNTYADKCTSLDAAAKHDVVQVAELAAKALGSSCPKDDKACVPRTWVQLFFQWSELAYEQQKPILDGFEDLFVGLIDHDWTRSVVGIGHVALAINTKDCKPCTIEMKLVRIVGAIGQFAETYSGKTSDPAGAREKVIEDLVTSLVDRTERDHGAVISIGGAVGIMGGIRLNTNGYQAAMPVRLTLGIGLQTYSSGTGGFHASIDAFDLGQYVTYDSNTLDVAPPDLKSSVIAGATIGYWFADRETPFFVAAHGAVSPFVRSTDGKVTYEFGALLGVYVPLLDFN